MSQQEQLLKESNPWVLVSTFKENISAESLAQITPQIQNLVDEWHSSGKIMWSGAFNDNRTGMAIFEASKEEADQLFAKYSQICQGVLDCFLYQWDAMPILSMLSKK